MQLSAWDAATIGIKAIAYSATFFGGGGIFFLQYSRSLISLDDKRRILRWVRLCAVIAIIVSAFRISILAGSMGDGLRGMFDPSMLRLILEAGEARAAGMRVAGLLLVATILLDSPSGLIAASLGAVVSVTSFAWVGHAWAAGRWSVALLSLHLIGVAFWLGALVPLSLIGTAGSLSTFARTAKRFGQIALIGVGILLVAGSLLLATLLRQWSDLWVSDYGRLIGGKLLAVTMLLAAAAVNKLRFTPRLQDEDPRAALGLLRSIRIELCLGGLIFVVTAVITSLVGPSALE